MPDALPNWTGLCLALFKNPSFLPQGPFSTFPPTSHCIQISSSLFSLLLLWIIFVHALSQTNAIFHARSYIWLPFSAAKHHAIWLRRGSKDAFNYSRLPDGKYIWRPIAWLYIISWQTTIDLRDDSKDALVDASDEATDTQTIFEAERLATFEHIAEQTSNNSIKVCN